MPIMTVCEAKAAVERVGHRLALGAHGGEFGEIMLTPSGVPFGDPRREELTYCAESLEDAVGTARAQHEADMGRIEAFVASAPEGVDVGAMQA